MSYVPSFMLYDQVCMEYLHVCITEILVLHGSKCMQIFLEISANPLEWWIFILFNSILPIRVRYTINLLRLKVIHLAPSTKISEVDCFYIPHLASVILGQQYMWELQESYGPDFFFCLWNGTPVYSRPQIGRNAKN